MTVFIKTIVLFFGQNKYTNIRRFEQFFVAKQGFLASKRYKKSSVLIKIAIKHISNYLQLVYFISLYIFINNLSATLKHSKNELSFTDCSVKYNIIKREM